MSQNIFDLANFVQRSGRWVRAHEIAQEGVKEAVADLHGDLNLSQNVKRFETGTYGELKSGQQRYNTRRRTASTNETASSLDGACGTRRGFHAFLGWGDP